MRVCFGLLVTNWSRPHARFWDTLRCGLRSDMHTDYTEHRRMRLIVSGKSSRLHRYPSVLVSAAKQCIDKSKISSPPAYFCRFPYLF
jgi:hypothetical protein